MEVQLCALVPGLQDLRVRLPPAYQGSCPAVPMSVHRSSNLFSDRNIPLGDRLSKGVFYSFFLDLFK